MNYSHTIVLCTFQQITHRPPDDNNGHTANLFTDTLHYIRQPCNITHRKQRASRLLSTYWRQRWWYLVLVAYRAISELQKKPTYHAAIAICLQKHSKLPLKFLFSPIICLTKYFPNSHKCFQVSWTTSDILKQQNWHFSICCFCEYKVNQKLYTTQMMSVGECRSDFAKSYKMHYYGNLLWLFEGPTSYSAQGCR